MPAQFAVKNSFWVLGILALVSISGRYLSSEPEGIGSPPVRHRVAEKQVGLQRVEDLDYLLGANATPSPNPGPQGKGRILCSLVLPYEPVNRRIVPYQNTRQLREDLDRKEQWINHILVRPVRRNGRPLGVRVEFTGSNPLARVGLQSGDIVLSLNQVPLTQVEDCPVLLTELRSAPSLRFLVERKGVVLPLEVHLPE